MTTLTVNTDKDFSTQVLASVDTIDFTNRVFVSATATFDASQFDDIRIKDNVAIDGTKGFNGIIVNGGSVDASQWSFSNWSSADNISLNGGSDADTITGSIQNDVINGGGGDDILDGGGGIDILNGGGGGDTISSLDGTGPNTIDGGGGSDFALLDLTGSTVALTIDIGDGGGGRDVGGGTTLARIERIAVGGGTADDTITGAALDDELFGGLGSDTLNGAGGNDSMVGGDGDDTILGGDGADQLIGNDGDDVLSGGGKNDELFGNFGHDLLTGGGGADSLNGGAGQDNLTGGGGADTFIFNNAADSAVGGARDLITDFVQGTDQIDISAIDAIAGGADDAFTFIAGQKFNNVAGELRFSQSASKTTISADLDGDGAADFQIALTGVINLTAADFIL